MPIISVEKLVKNFHVKKRQSGLWGSVKGLFDFTKDSITAVNDISFTIDEGELVGFIGPNGAGKTTTLKCLSGLLYPSSGKISVAEFVPFQRKPKFLKKISLVMGQKNQLWWDLAPIETFKLHQAIYEITDKTFKKTLSTLTELLAAESILDTPVRKLSLGQRMKGELIAALLHSPSILFLDEPTIGLDVTMQKTIRDFLKDYNREFKATILLTSHYMEDIKQLTKRVLIINNGSLLFDGKLKEISDTYTQNKIITCTLSKKLVASSLEPFGQVIESNPYQIKLKVPSSRSLEIISKIIQTLPISDITIEELPIDSIIHDIFENGQIQTPSHE